MFEFREKKVKRMALLYRKVAIGSDHAAIREKQELKDYLVSLGVEVNRCLHRNSSHNPAIKNAIPADHASSGHLTAIRRTPLDECDSPRTRLMPRAAPTTLFL